MLTVPKHMSLPRGIHVFGADNFFANAICYLVVCYIRKVNEHELSARKTISILC